LVEVQREFVQVAIKVRRTYRTFMGSLQPAYEQRGDAVRQWQEVVADISILTNHRVFVAFGGQPRIAAPAIGAHQQATRRYAFLYGTTQSHTRCIRYATKASASQSPIFTFNRNDNQRLTTRVPV